MWSPNRIVSNALIALGLSSAMLLSGCSGFTPVYGGHALTAEQQAFRYAEPDTRLDQIIYQELVLRFGRSTDPGRPLVKISTVSTSRHLTKSDLDRPSEPRQATVTATIEVTSADGRPLLATTRSASVPYQTDDQALAADEAQKAAYEQAARALAETIRLTLLGTLGPAGA